MATLTLSRPDLEAHRQATTAAFSDVVAELVSLIGRKLTAYIGGVKDVRAVDRWASGADSYKSAEERVRLAFQISKTLAGKECPRVIQAWLTGVNPQLNDRVPIRLLRDGDVHEVGSELMGAVRAFLSGG